MCCKAQRIKISTLLCAMTLFPPIFPAAEKVKVAEIIDANLFRTKDGRILRLAGVRTPSVNDPDPSLSRFARRIMDETAKEILKQPVHIVADTAETTRGDTLSVHLWRKYDLATISLNRRYLERGYGIYVPSESGIDAAYQEAAEKAVRKRFGIWNPRLFSPVFPPKWDHRYRLFPGLIWNPAARSEKTAFVVNFNKRWSYFPADALPTRIGAALSWELGTYHLVLPYVALGPELRIGKTFFVSPHLGSIFFIHPVFLFIRTVTGEWPSPFFYGFKIGGFLWPGKKSRPEWELGVEWLAENRDRKPFYFIGMGMAIR